MENASKALIIAGAILLSILLISLGIMIYNQASGVVNNNAMTEVEVSSFNQKFEQYFGGNVRGANARALVNAVLNNNRSTDDNSKKISITGAATVNDTNLTANNIATGQTYNIIAAGNTTGGLISDITITEN